MRTPEPDPIAARRVTLIDARAASPIVQRSYLAPSYAASTGREALALDLLAEILGSGTQSRLYKSLVIDQKIAAYAAAWYSGDQLDSGTFGVYGAPNPGVDVDKVEAAIDAVLADLLKNGVTQQELDRVRNQAIAERVYTLDNQAALARMAGVALTTGLSARSIFDRDVEIAKVTPRRHQGRRREDCRAEAVRHRRSASRTANPELKLGNPMRLLFLRIIVAGFTLAISFTAAYAIEIKEVTSPGGIKAWLVENKSIPLIAMNFSFEGGSTSDPAGKEGTAHFLTGMMDEGAGDLDGAAFQALRDELAVRINFDSGMDQFEGSLQTLSKNRAQAFDLLKKVLTAPHFEKTAMERVRQQFLVSAINDEQEPESLASRAWMELAFGNQLYARKSSGTPQSLAAITPDDLQRHAQASVQPEGPEGRRRGRY